MKNTILIICIALCVPAFSQGTQLMDSIPGVNMTLCHSLGREYYKIFNNRLFTRHPCDTISCTFTITTEDPILVKGEYRPDEKKFKITFFEPYRRGEIILVPRGVFSAKKIVGEIIETKHESELIETEAYFTDICEKIADYIRRQLGKKKK